MIIITVPVCRWSVPPSTYSISCVGIARIDIDSVAYSLAGMLHSTCLCYVASTTALARTHIGSAACSLAVMLHSTCVWYVATHNCLGYPCHEYTHVIAWLDHKIHVGSNRWCYSGFNMPGQIRRWTCCTCCVGIAQTGIGSVGSSLHYLCAIPWLECYIACVMRVEFSFVFMICDEMMAILLFCNMSYVLFSCAGIGHRWCRLEPTLPMYVLGVNLCTQV